MFTLSSPLPHLCELLNELLGLIIFQTFHTINNIVVTPAGNSKKLCDHDNVPTPVMMILSTTQPDSYHRQLICHLQQSSHNTFPVSSEEPDHHQSSEARSWSGEALMILQPGNMMMMKKIWNCRLLESLFNQAYNLQQSRSGSVFFNWK